MMHLMPAAAALIIVLSLAAISAPAQQYDVVLRGGRVMDPANQIDGPMDVAVAGNRIAAVAPHIADPQARQVINVTGLIVAPGLVDVHAHVFGYEGSLSPDDSALPAGTTTIVDAGGSGWRTFEEFRRTVIARSATRVLVWLNIVGAGMVGEPYESDVDDMDPAHTADTIGRNRDLIVGIKTAHFAKPGWAAIDRSVEAGRRAGVPVMVDDKIFTDSQRTTEDELLRHLRPGDIHTHMYNDRQMELVDRFTGKVQPWMIEARRRGVLFDVGHGGGSFLWPVATKAIQQGFLPDTISTDLHSSSILIQQADMPNVMSKMMLLGMSLDDVIFRSTVTPAKEIGRYPEVGTLGIGRTADIAVLEDQSGVFAFKDSWPARRIGTRRLECVLTLRAGRIVYDRDARAFPAWKAANEDPPARQPGEPVGSKEPSGRAPVSGEQIYDLLLKHGRVIDPANHRDTQLDVGVIGNRIMRVAPDLPAAHARVVIEAGGYIVTPGLIDINAHFDATLKPDYNTLPGGVTTAVDAGSATCQTLSDFKKQVINHAKVRVLAFISATDAACAARAVGQDQETVVGIAASPATLDAALTAARASGAVVMATGDAGLLLKELRPGDISLQLPQADGKLSPVIEEARRRGILFDSARGDDGLWFGLAHSAVARNLLPETISSGMDAKSTSLPRATLTTVMSIFLNLGMSGEQIIERVTSRAAQAIKRPQLGSLSEGAIADIAVLDVREGTFGFGDSRHTRLDGTRRFDCLLTVRNGVIVWDSKGLSIPDTARAGPYSNFK
jgi:dihydroorotase